MTLCNPMDRSLPGFSVHGILQAGILEWVAMPSSRGSSRPRDQTCIFCSSCNAGGFFTTEPPGKPFSNLTRLTGTNASLSHAREGALSPLGDM